VSDPIQRPVERVVVICAGIAGRIVALAFTLAEP
jgi:hypothetical protein